MTPSVQITLNCRAAIAIIRLTLPLFAVICSTSTFAQDLVGCFDKMHKKTFEFGFGYRADLLFGMKNQHQGECRGLERHGVFTGHRSDNLWTTQATGDYKIQIDPGQISISQTIEGTGHNFDKTALSGLSASVSAAIVWQDTLILHAKNMPVAPDITAVPANPSLYRVSIPITVQKQNVDCSLIGDKNFFNYHAAMQAQAYAVWAMPNFGGFTGGNEEAKILQCPDSKKTVGMFDAYNGLPVILRLFIQSFVHAGSDSTSPYGSVTPKTGSAHVILENFRICITPPPETSFESASGHDYTCPLTSN